MLDSLFRGLFDSDTAAVISVGDFLLCVGCALALGALLALAQRYRTQSSGSFLATLALLPAVVCVVIMMVNGNVGTGVAVAGAFSLVRFRSVPGTAREIGALFLAMGAGLMCGMGYLAYAVLFTTVLCAFTVLYSRISLGGAAQSPRTLHITIPEDLDYSGVFDDIFEEYLRAWELTGVKTVNMGSLFRLTYQVMSRDRVSDKEFIDKLRCRNGNLEISLLRQETPAVGL